MSARAEILVNGPKGFSYASVEVEADGKIHPAFAEAAFAQALNLYNELPEPNVEVSEHAKNPGF